MDEGSNIVSLVDRRRLKNKQAANEVADLDDIYSENFSECANELCEQPEEIVPTTPKEEIVSCNNCKFIIDSRPWHKKLLGKRTFKNVMCGHSKREETTNSVTGKTAYLPIYSNSLSTATGQEWEFCYLVNVYGRCANFEKKDS